MLPDNSELDLKNHSLLDPNISPPHFISSLLINPREEDPFEFIELDMPGTFLFVERDDISAIKKRRARYTINLLRLNDREYLIEGRRKEFTNLINALSAYAMAKNAGDQMTMDRNMEVIQKCNHYSVWVSLKMTHQFLPVNLRDVFHNNPEVLNW